MSMSALYLVLLKDVWRVFANFLYGKSSLKMAYVGNCFLQSLRWGEYCTLGLLRFHLVTQSLTNNVTYVLCP